MEALRTIVDYRRPVVPDLRISSEGGRRIRPRTPLLCPSSLRLERLGVSQYEAPMGLSRPASKSLSCGEWSSWPESSMLPSRSRRRMWCPPIRRVVAESSEREESDDCAAGYPQSPVSSLGRLAGVRWRRVVDRRERSGRISSTLRLRVRGPLPTVPVALDERVVRIGAIRRVGT